MAPAYFDIASCLRTRLHGLTPFNESDCRYLREKQGGAIRRKMRKHADDTACRPANAKRTASPHDTLVQRIAMDVPAPSIP